MLASINVQMPLGVKYYDFILLSVLSRLFFSETSLLFVTIIRYDKIIYHA